MSSHSHWQTTTPPLPNYGNHPDADADPEYSYSYRPKTAPRTHSQGYAEAYSQPPTPYESYPQVPGEFPQDDWGHDAGSSSHGRYGYGYSAQHTPMPNMDPFAYAVYDDRPPSPKYIGRRSRSRASSKVSSTGGGGKPVKHEADPWARRKWPQNTRGYKAPTVESAPTSPLLLPTLASDEERDHLLLDNPDYTPPKIPYEPPVSDPVLPKKGERRPLRELFIVPDTSTSTTESTAPSSPAPSSPTPSSPGSDYLVRERERRQYTQTYIPHTPAVPLKRKPQPYSYSPKQSKVEPHEPAKTSYAATGADLSHRREDLRVPGQRQRDIPASSPSGSWANDYSIGSHSPHLSPRPTEQLVQRPETPDDDDLPPIPPCPGKQRVVHGHWWNFAYEPDFKVCEQCYEDDIYETEFADNFVEYALREGESISCSFNTPRIKHAVWPTTLDDGNLQGFSRYVSARAQVPSCTEISKSTMGIWFQMQLSEEPRLPMREPPLSLLACHACYEDVVRASKFSLLFERMEGFNPDAKSTCHVSSAPFIETHLLTDSLSVEQFREDVLYRLQVKPCPQENRTIDYTLRWWKPKDTNTLLRICDACYCDGIYPTEFRDRFIDVHQNQSDEPWFCCVGAYDLNLVWKHAVGKGDYDLWFEAAVAALAERCHPIPRIGGTWKMIDDPKFHKFSICTRCADTYFAPFGFAKHLVDKPTDQKTRNWCGLSSYYGKEIVRALADAGHWGQFKHFLDYLDHRVASLPCPGEKDVVRDKWWRSQYGWFCEECFRFAVRSSQFVKFVERERSNSPQRCDLGNTDGRELWQAACKKPRRTLAIQDFERGLDVCDEMEEIGEKLSDAERREARAGYAEQFRLRRKIGDLELQKMDLAEELKHLKV